MVVTAAEFNPKSLFQIFNINQLSHCATILFDYGGAVK
jgi:hypothetical protein